MPEKVQIVLTDLVEDYPPEAMEALKSSGVVYVNADYNLGSVSMDIIRNAEALLVTWMPVTKEVIDQLENCRVIIRIGVGHDNIDGAAARERGIPVCNVPDYCKGEVADHAMAMALSLARGLPYLDKCVRQGPWKPQLPYPMPAFEVLNFGVIGYGRIGRSTIARARGFGFHLSICDPYVNEAEVPSDVKLVGLEEMLASVDILSLHTLLNAETRHLINAERLALMKPSAILVNTSRGPVVDTVALADALTNRRLAAAGVDVFEDEPLALDHPLLAAPNTLFAPHWAWHSRESKPKLYCLAIEEAVRAVRGEPLRSCVNGVQPNMA